MVQGKPDGKTARIASGGKYWACRSKPYESKTRHRDPAYSYNPSHLQDDKKKRRRKNTAARRGIYRRTGDVSAQKGGSSNIMDYWDRTKSNKGEHISTYYEWDEPEQTYIDTGKIIKGTKPRFPIPDKGRRRRSSNVMSDNSSGSMAMAVAGKKGRKPKKPKQISGVKRKRRKTSAPIRLIEGGQ